MAVESATTERISNRRREHVVSDEMEALVRVDSTKFRVASKRDRQERCNAQYCTKGTDDSPR